jgi:urease accessory protein
MTTGTGMAGAEALARLRLAQLMSPAFPVGSFAHSQGLEAAIAAGAVASPADVETWVRASLVQGSARLDGVLLGLGLRPGADLPALADLARALTPARGRATEQAETGAAFAALTGAAPLPYPLAVAAATRPLGLPASEVIARFLQGLAAQAISAAVRFLPMGAAQGQAMLATLAPLLAETAAAAAVAGEDDLWTFAPGAEIFAMAQEWLPERSFRS